MINFVTNEQARRRKAADTQVSNSVEQCTSKRIKRMRSLSEYNVWHWEYLKSEFMSIIVYCYR